MTHKKCLFVCLFTFYDPRIFCNLEHIKSTQFDIVKKWNAFNTQIPSLLIYFEKILFYFFNIVNTKICSRHLHTLNLYDRKVNKIQMFIFIAKIF